MRDKTKYITYINSIEWKEKRKQVLDFRWSNCQACWNTGNLHIHHWTYKRLFKEKIADLFVLCSKCHKDLHDKYWTIDLLRSTKAFIKWVDIIPRKKKKRMPLEERRKLREERKLLEIPKAIEAINKWLKFKQSWVSSIKNWRKALIIIKEQIKL